MVDRTAEIRDALVWFGSSQTIHRSEQHPISVMAEAARAYADLLDEVERIKMEEAPGDWPMLLLAAVTPVDAR